MPIIIDEIKKIIFIAPPKCGCSTVRLTVGKFLFPEITNVNYSNNVYNSCYHKLIVKHVENDFKDYKIIFIYRNIYERFKSYLNNIILNRISTHQNLKNNNLKDWLIYLNKFENFNKSKLNKKTNILDIIKFNKTIIDSCNIDYHGFSQSYFYYEFLEKFKNVKEDKIEFININELSIILKKYYGFVKLNNVYLNFKGNNFLNNNLSLDNILNIDIINNKNIKEEIDILYKRDIAFFDKFNIKFNDNKKYLDLILKKYPILKKLNYSHIKSVLKYDLSILKNFDLNAYDFYNPDLRKNIPNFYEGSLILHFIKRGYHYENRKYNYD